MPDSGGYGAKESSAVSELRFAERQAQPDLRLCTK